MEIFYPVMDGWMDGWMDGCVVAVVVCVEEKTCYHIILTK